MSANTDPAELAEAVCAGSRRALARAITLVESTRRDHRKLAAALLERLAARVDDSMRIGISGVPGVGKSTFVDAFGLHAIEQGRRVAVLSVDPSSSLSGGSILGDKTRMEQLSRHPQAFVRPSPARQSWGGVARHTCEAIALCEAARFDLTIVETVGVGQSETAVVEMTDMFVLLLMPAAGDQLQGIKRGIMELADLVLINKADGELLGAARRAADDYQQALRLIQPRSSLWTATVQVCSALDRTGIREAWETVCRYHEAMTCSGNLAARRGAQAKKSMWDEATQEWIEALRNHPTVRDRLAALEMDVSAGRLPAAVAAQQLLDAFLNRATDEHG